MREVLFRGKRVDNGEWVYGGILQTENWTSIFTYKDYQGSINEPPSCDVEDYEVDPSSVGQYTGLTDKNGNRIFEGDIFRCLDGGMDGIPRMVRWDEDDMQFRCPLIKYHWAYGKSNCSLWLMKYRDIEIIGNIHDNPELLKGGVE